MIEELKKQIINNLTNNRSVSINYTIVGIPYVIMFMAPNKAKGINDFN